MGAFVMSQFHYTPRGDVEGLDDVAVFDLGGVRIRAIHTPGHTRGHCVLLVEPDGVLFLGDIDLSSFGPYYGDAWSCLDDWERSLDLVRRLEARVWVSFHHVGIIEDRGLFLARLERFAARITDREGALLDALAEPRTLEDLVRQRFVYPAHVTLPFVDAVERRTIRQHLDRVLARGQAERVGPDRYVRTA
jgi:glyoxylase-like metal-dependent hydrolase (beta-lactamase superfamily II)